MDNDTKFKYQHSELLDLLLSFYNQKLINQEQKIKIKELIIGKSSSLDSIIIEYEKTQNQKKLLSSLKELCGDKATDYSDNDEDPNIMSVTSPMDSSLRKRKVKKEMEAKKNMHHNEDNQNEEEDINIKECEEGMMSPPITFTNKFKK